MLPRSALAARVADDLDEIGFWLERARSETRRVHAYRHAAEIVRGLAADDVAERAAAARWSDLDGIGPRTAAAIRASVAGDVPDRLAALRRAGEAPLAAVGPARKAQRGDLHVHTDWSDGGSRLGEMLTTARRIGLAWCAITDHSPRLRVARGLSAERLREQMQQVAQWNDTEAGEGFRALTGIEVDILADGRLDQERDVLGALDVCVASVHSDLRADAETMTRRMVAAVVHPRVNVLGHCTGRLVEGSRGTRPPSRFDAEVVFEACRQHDVAVEINSRPERCDPPDDLLVLAVEMGCLFSVDTDAHAPGQLAFADLGCARADAAGIDPERIVTTWSAEAVVEWARAAL